MEVTSLVQNSEKEKASPGILFQPIFTNKLRLLGCDNSTAAVLKGYRKFNALSQISQITFTTRIQAIKSFKQSF